jgi:hypothetical protein
MPADGNVAHDLPAQQWAQDTPRTLEEPPTLRRNKDGMRKMKPRRGEFAEGMAVVTANDAIKSGDIAFEHIRKDDGAHHHRAEEHMKHFPHPRGGAMIGEDTMPGRKNAPRFPHPHGKHHGMRPRRPDGEFGAARRNIDMPPQKDLPRQH